MPKVFRVIPKTIRKINGTLLTPDMDVIVTTRHSMSDPFCDGGIEVMEEYQRKYNFDYRRAACQKSDFTCEPID